MRQIETKTAARQSLAWIGQAVSGVLLIVVLLLHMVFHHFQEGLLSSDGVVEHVSSPAVFGLELLFVIVVTYHALLGIRAVLFDLSLTADTRRKISTGLAILGVATAAYGVLIAFLIRSQVLAG